MKTYNIVTSNGVTHNIKAHSAADAIGRILEGNEGCTVVKCWQGSYGGAFIEFDIPKHEPYLKPLGAVASGESLEFGFSGDYPSQKKARSKQ